MDHLVAGCVIFGGGQTQRGTVLQGQNLLHRPFAEGLFAQDDGPRSAGSGCVLQAAGDDLGGAGAAVVHEDNERQSGMRATAR